MRRRITALFLALAVSGPAFSDDADPPGRVGRLSYLEAEVTMQPAEAGAPEDAELNRPLTLGDRLMTTSGSRAEMSIGTAAIRLDESTDLSIANLDDDIAQIELNSGTLGITLRELREGETFEIDTPNAAVLLRRPGDYRIEVDSQGATVLAVRTGEAELDGGAGPVRLSVRRELRFTGAEQLADVSALGPLNAFDEWCIERERAIADAQATRYVSRDVVGYEDLDTHGSWYSEPGYGHVWAPHVVFVGWAPYRYGHWSWIGPWGWTWIDHAPWGFAPFHYGRWAFLRHRWCWVPGPRRHRPVWSPAHVRWTGGSHPGGVVHGGKVGWFPLGPREVHVPWHHASPRYLRNVNIANTTVESNAVITNVARNRVRNIRFANRDAPDAVSTMPAAAFDAHRAGAQRVLTRRRDGGARPIRNTPTLQAGPSRDSRWRDNVAMNTGAAPRPRDDTDRNRFQNRGGNNFRDENFARRDVRPHTPMRAEQPRDLSPRPAFRAEQPRGVSPRTAVRPDQHRAMRAGPAPRMAPHRAPQSRSSQPSRHSEQNAGRSHRADAPSSSGAAKHRGLSGRSGSPSRAQSGRSGFSTNRQ